MSLYHTTTPQKIFLTVAWLIAFIPLTALALLFFVTGHGFEMWCGGGMSAVFAFGVSQMWWRKINNRPAY